MRNLIFSLLAGFLLLSCNKGPVPVDPAADTNAVNVQSATVRDGVFIHITESYNDPHRVLMPLKMAVMMASDKDVIVYLDIHAVELLTKQSKDLSFADFESCHTYIHMLSEKGVGVYACPTCMKIAGIKAEDLLDGVQVAAKDKFFNFTKGRIITLDY